MTRYFLTRVSIEGFRGVNNEGDPLVLEFKTTAVNSVFGPNGLGKSSTFEALSYAIRGTIPKLTALPAADNPSEYYANRFHTAGTAVIELTLTPDDGGKAVSVRVERSANGIRSVTSPSGCPDPEVLLASLASEAILLDYRTFNQFVDDTPLRRGRTFSALVGLGGLSEFRQVLETLSHAKSLRSDFGLDALETAIQAEVQKSNAALVGCRSAFKKVTGSALQEPVDVAKAGEVVLAALATVELIKPSVSGPSFAEIEFDEVRAAVKNAEGGSQRERLAAIVRELAEMAALARPDTEAQQYQELRLIVEQREDAIGKTRGQLHQQLLEAAERLLKGPSWSLPSTCPLCDTDSLSSPIGEHVATHLKEYGAVRELDVQIKAHLSSTSWFARLRNLSKVVGSADDEGALATIEDTFSAGASVANIDASIVLLDELDTARQQRVVALTAERESIEQSLPPSLVTLTEQIEHAAALQADLERYARSNSATKEKLVQFKVREAWCKFMDSAADEFAKAEVKLSTAHTLAIEADYRSLYEKVTRNPNIVPILKKASGSEELHLRLEKFFSLSGLSASTLLPESYRNALAICIFLAAAQKAQTVARFIVLDDVTSSFDNGHQWNLMEIIRQVIAVPGNMAGPQVILLSHDGSLEKYFDTLSSEATWHHQKLQGAPPQGAVLTQVQDGSRLRKGAEQFLNAGQTEQASPLIRQYLEFSLLRIIRKAAIAVPLDFSIRDDKKMADNCIRAIESAVELHRAAGDLILAQPQQDDLRKTLLPRLVGNWLSHYATGSTASISAYVLLGVLDDIDAVTECFRYLCTCSGGAQRMFYKSLSPKTHCSCG